MAKMMLHDDAARRGLGRGVGNSPERCAAPSGPKGMNAIMDRLIGTPMFRGTASASPGDGD